MPLGRTLTLSVATFLLAAGPWPRAESAAFSDQERVTILSHDIVVTLTPARHELYAIDSVELELPPRVTSVSFTLAPTLQIESILFDSRPDESLPFTREGTTQSSGGQVVVTLPADHGPHLSLQWNYRGIVKDPPREPRHLRFVTPSETAGHIGPEGVYLSSESQWYPDIEGSLSAYRVVAETPEGWTVVTQGAKKQETTRDGVTTSTWDAPIRSEALTLVANRFVVKAREWTGPDGRPIELATYFFPEDAHLADEYLEATAKYLDAYVLLLGDYPFEKFVVVENFFASGLGMPSFTLLGSGSIKRHYVQPYALGHEIVHSWIGNSVLNRADEGNWVEGLTTYLANYYWHELVGDAEQAAEQRRLMMQTFSVYVTPERDYPVGQFTRKSDERDNAIGYQKSAFVFHLLRQEIGDDAFFRGLRTLTRRYRNRFADWRNLEHLFAEESRRDLRWFFEQWIDQAGAPSLSFGEVSARRLADAEEGAGWLVTIRVKQGGTPFRVTVPVGFVTGEGTEIKQVTLGPLPESHAEFQLPQRPLRVLLDPDSMVFKRIARAQLPPMLNGYVTDSHRSMISAFSDRASPLQQVVDRVIDQEARLPESAKTVMLQAKEGAVPSNGSILMLADREHLPTVWPFITESCGDLIRLNGSAVQLNGQVYEEPATAVLFSCRRANVPGSVLTVLYGTTSRAVASVSRFLFYYGWQSYVVFQNGSATSRGLWQSLLEQKEVRIDGKQ